jgi:membrane associated rhomboid family serine protease
MMPLKDNIPSRKFPVVTVALIVVNSVIFFLEVMMGQRATAITNTFGVVPQRLTSAWLNPMQLLTLFTSMYLHGGWAHLIGNMLYLWIFGDNVEESMGRLRFFIFYTLSGLIAVLIQVMSAPNLEQPIIGASGAIAGVLGAYLLLFPGARVQTLVPSFYFYRLVWLPAIIVLGGWFLLQLLQGIASINVSMQTGGVAWWAHIGGFAAGMVLQFVFRRSDYESPSRRLDQRNYDRRGVRW